MAYHEAGHAAAAHALGCRLHRVTIKPGKDYLGAVYHKLATSQDAWHANDERAKPRYERDVKIALAGACAVKLAFPGSRWRVGAEADNYFVGDVTLHLYPDPQMQYLWARLMALETEALLRWRWFAVEALAEALLEHHALNGAQAVQVIQRAFTTDYERRARAAETRKAVAAAGLAA